ncbi:MAG: chorismate mutase [Candidatus Gastranaerophilales bacterium]|nr:chorismate mutase [Candidatus Gastranaerophilales bacterium]
MYSRGVRGAITLDENTQEAVKQGIIELLDEILIQNEIATEDIAFAIFTLTNDINADFPAKYARLHCKFNNVPMMCYHELETPNSLKKCLRVLLNINTNKAQDEIKHIYLKGAKILREDITNGNN